MTASPMPQATALAETPPLNHRDRQYRAEAISGRIGDVRNLLIAMDHVQQDRITGFADHTGNCELLQACDQIASLHVIAVEALETTARLADELAAMLASGPDTFWDTAMQRWLAAKAEAEQFHAPYAVGAKDHTDDTAASADWLDKVACDLQTELMAMPAPHFAALRFKLDHLLEDDNGTLNPWTDSYVEQTRRDIARLLGEA